MVIGGAGVSKVWGAEQRIRPTVPMPRASVRLQLSTEETLQLLNAKTSISDVIINRLIGHKIAAHG